MVLYGYAIPACHSLPLFSIIDPVCSGVTLLTYSGFEVKIVLAVAVL
jgi:hypothetical protein